jgi:hypothetical protein
LVLHSLGWYHSSCTFVTAIENDDNRYLIDDLEESKEFRLVMPVLGIPRTVAHGLARPFIEGTLFNSHPVPKGYAIVHVDRVKPGYRRSKLEYRGGNGECSPQGQRQTSSLSIPHDNFGEKKISLT